MTSGKKIGNLLRGKGNDKKEEISVVYQVPCGNCDRTYIGETGRGIDKRLKEHKSDWRNDRDHSAFVNHAHHTNHIPNWGGATVLATCKTKENRKATEAAYIATSDTINTRAGFIKWAKSAAVFGLTSMPV